MVEMPDRALRPNFFGSHRKPSTLIICESKSPIPDLFPENSVFLDQVINSPLLLKILPHPKHFGSFPRFW